MFDRLLEGVVWLQGQGRWHPFLVRQRDVQWRRKLVGERRRIERRKLVGERRKLVGERWRIVVVRERRGLRQRRELLGRLR